MKHLILAGAGHAHLITILNINKLVKSGCRVTVISSGDYHYYSGMGPGLLSGIYKPTETRFHVKKMTEDRGGEFINGRVVRILPLKKRIFLFDKRALDYDVLSCNMGSEIIPVTGKGSEIIPVKPIENLFKAGLEIKKRTKYGSLNILVIGGGAAGVEVAGNLFRLVQKAGGKAGITIVSATEILSRYNPSMRRHALNSFAKRGISVFENSKASQITSNEIILDDGMRLPFDFAFNAAGIRPTQVFRDSGFEVSSDGALAVNEFLQCPQYPEIFGGGDCISFIPKNLDRVGVYAVRQGPVLYANISAAIFGGAIREFIPQSRYLSILNMGDGSGILSWRSHVTVGRFAFFLKDYIDTSFMKRFQVSGERNEA